MTWLELPAELPEPGVPAEHGGSMNPPGPHTTVVSPAVLISSCSYRNTEAGWFTRSRAVLPRTQRGPGT
uniref:Uncharacterized protein n=1 Tax=Otus sunia TaxID=257818 RepID=A0A8C8AAV9_9STRI